MVKKYNLTMATLILLSNFYLLYITLIVISTNGGPFGFSIIALPFTFLAHLFILPSIMVLKKKHNKSPILLLTNTIGITYYLLMVLLFTP